jgi:chemotaxis family two-component system response regulator Rcp1
LNMPKMDGRDVLARIKEDEDLEDIPTIVLTSSEAEADIVKSYQLGANCYLCKPMHFDAFYSLMKSLNDFWLTRVKLHADDREVGQKASLGRGLPTAETNFSP